MASIKILTNNSLHLDWFSRSSSPASVGSDSNGLETGQRETQRLETRPDARRIDFFCESQYDIV